MVYDVLMKIRIKVKPNSREQKVEVLPDGSFKIQVKSIAEKGKANEEIIKILADYFDTPKSNIRIILGQGSSNKLVEIKGL